MEGLIAILVIWFIINVLTKGLKAAGSSGRRDQSGQTPVPPGSQRRMPARPPLTPVARPGSTGAPDWSEIMTMLSGQQVSSAQPRDMEGMSTESSGPSGSLTGPDMMEGSGMMDGSRFIMEGSQPMMDESGPDYEGATLPGELSSDAVAMLPKSEAPVSAPPLRPVFQPKKYDPAAMRDAVIWAEILAKPKSLRRVAR